MADDGWRGAEPFACAPGMRVEAHERLVELQVTQLTGALARVEAELERLERRLWLAVFGVVGVILSQAALQILEVTP